MTIDRRGFIKTLWLANSTHDNGTGLVFNSQEANKIGDALSAALSIESADKVRSFEGSGVSTLNYDGSFWDLDEASSKADDVGTVLRRNVGGGAWLRRYAGDVNVKWFGAKGASNGIVVDDTEAIQAACDAAKLESAGVYVPRGSYGVSKMLILGGINRDLRGDGKAKSIFQALSNFQDSTIVGLTVKAMIYHGHDSGHYLDTGFIYGGTIKDIQLQCTSGGLTAGLVSGIISNRLVTTTKYVDVWIRHPLIGLHGTNRGWGTNIDSVEVFHAYDVSIKLENAYNGVVLTACKLWGEGFKTPTHFKATNACQGIIFNGGFIENCEVGFNINKKSQLVVTGVNIEKCYTHVFIASGTFAAATGALFESGHPSIMTGCNIVDVVDRSSNAVVANSASIQFENNNITGTPSATHHFLNGIAGTNNGDNKPNFAINDRNNRWNTVPDDLQRTGRVFSVEASQHIGRLHVGKTTTPIVIDDDKPYALRCFEPIWVETHVNGVIPALALGGEVLVTELKGYADRAMTALGMTAEEYAIVHPERFAGALSVYAEIQPTGDHTAGIARLTAKLLDRTNIVSNPNEYGIEVKASTGALLPLVDDGLRLGVPSRRYSDISAVNGVISTSDDRLKTYDDISEQERSCAKDAAKLIKKFRWNDSIKKKGDNARIHFGTSAQSLIDCFANHGLDAMDYGLICHDKWYVDKDGSECIKSPNAIKKDRYSIRYSELLCFIIISK